MSKVRARTRRRRIAMGCPRPDKVWFPTKELAEASLNRLGETGRDDGLNAYECACKRWHLGRRRG